jgi:hypothetical protein
MGTVCVFTERWLNFMASIPVTHWIVQDNPMPNQTEVIGRMFVPEFKSVIPEYSPNFIGDEDEAGSFVDDVEAKVVKPRGRRPKAPTEGVETK